MMERADRLRQARLAAGFETATDAADRHGWKYPTYAGHENGARGIKPRDIAKYAVAFGVDPSWLEFGDKPLRPLSRDPVPSGLSEAAEPYVSEYTPPTDSIRLALTRLIETLGPAKHTLAPFRIAIAVPGLQITAGDVLIADIADHKGKDGDVLVCQVANETDGTARLDLRLRQRGALFAPLGARPAEPGERETAMGRVTLTLRGLPA